MILLRRILLHVFCILPGSSSPLGGPVSLQLHGPSLELCFVSYKLLPLSLGDPSVLWPSFECPGHLGSNTYIGLSVCEVLLAVFLAASRWLD